MHVILVVPIYLLPRLPCANHLPVIIHERPAQAPKQRCTALHTANEKLNGLAGLCELSCNARYSTVRSEVAQPMPDLRIGELRSQARVTCHNGTSGAHNEPGPSPRGAGTREKHWEMWCGGASPGSRTAACQMSRTGADTLAKKLSVNP